MRKISIIRFLLACTLIVSALSTATNSHAATSTYTNNDAPKTAFYSESKQKWGFKDIYGEVVIRPKYSYAESFRNGYAIVKKKNLYGVINQDGRYVISPKYELIEYGNHFTYIVTYSGIKGLFAIEDAKKAKQVTPFMYDGIQYVTSRNEYVTTIDNYKGILANSGVEVIECKYEEISYNTNSNAYIVVSNGLKGILTHSGDKVVDCKYDDISYNTANKVYTIVKDGLKGVLTTDGKEIIQCKYDDISYNSLNGVYYVTKDGFKGIFNKIGNKISECVYTDIIASSKYILAILNNECVIYDTTSTKQINNFTFDTITKTNNNFIFNIGGKYGLITDKTYKQPITLYDSIDTSRLNGYVVTSNNKYGVLYSDGTIFIPAILLDHIDPAKLWNQWQLCDSDGEYYMLLDKMLTLSEYEEEYNHPWDQGYSTTKTQQDVIFNKIISPVKFERVNDIFEENIGEDTYTHNKGYKTITLNDYSIDIIRHQIDKQDYIYIQKENKIVGKISGNAICNFAQIDVNNLQLRSIQAMSNNDLLLEVANIQWGWDGETTTYVIIIDGKNFTLKNSIILPEESIIVGISNYDGWYVGSNADMFFADSSHAIIKYSNKCGLVWSYTPKEGIGFASLCETPESLYLGGYTQNNGYIGKFNPYICRLDRSKGTKKNDKFYKITNQDYSIVKFDEGKAQVAPIRQRYGDYFYYLDEVMTYDFNDIEPYRLEVKRRIHNDICAYGLVNQYNEWVVKPVLPGEKPVTYEDWTVSPCSVKTDDKNKLNVSKDANIKHKKKAIKWDKEVSSDEVIH